MSIVEAVGALGVDFVGGLSRAPGLLWGAEQCWHDHTALIAEPGLAAAPEPFNVRLGYLDFETIARAVPVWPGMGPWHQAAAQYSYREERPCSISRRALAPPPRFSYNGAVMDSTLDRLKTALADRSSRRSAKLRYPRLSGNQSTEIG